jgi:HEAT repeat protein
LWARGATQRLQWQGKNQEGATRDLLLAFAAVNAVLILMVLLRRGVKSLAFAWRDDLRLAWAHTVDRVLQGTARLEEVAAPRPPWERAAAEATLEARWAASAQPQREVLRALFDRWGLLTRRRRDVRRGRLWQQGRAALLLGRLRCQEALPDLLWLLQHGKAEAQLAAISALHLMGSPEAIDGLVAYVAGGKHRRRRRLVWGALMRCSRRQPWRLIPHLQQPEAEVRAIVAAALAETATAAETQALSAAAGDSDAEVRASVARALGRAADPRALPALRRLAGDPVWFVRLQAVGSAGRWNGGENRALLLQATRDPDWRVRRKAAGALVALSPDPVALLSELRQQQDRYALEAAVSALERQGVTWRALQTLACGDMLERAQSAALLRLLGEAGKTEALRYAAEKHPEERVRAAVEHLLPAASTRAEPDGAPVAHAEDRRRRL